MKSYIDRATLKRLLPKLDIRNSSEIRARVAGAIPAAISILGVNRNLIENAYDGRTKERDSNGNRIRLLELYADGFRLRIFYTKITWWSDIKWKQDFSKKRTPVEPLPPLSKATIPKKK